MVERQSCKLKVLGSIPSGGLMFARDLFMLRRANSNACRRVWTSGVDFCPGVCHSCAQRRIFIHGNEHAHQRFHRSLKEPKSTQVEIGHACACIHNVPAGIRCPTRVCPMLVWDPMAPLCFRTLCMHTRPRRSLDELNTRLATPSVLFGEPV